MTRFFDVETVAVEALGYRMSWLELVGTLCYLWSVILTARRSLLTWPVSLVAVALYAALFWQIRLYADAIEQAYYLGASVYGWWNWRRARAEATAAVPVAYGPGKAQLSVAAVTVALSVAASLAMERVHRWWPALFPEPADYPWADATTTVMSLVAMWLTTRRRVESWIYWILVDAAGIVLYAVKDVKFVALLYVVLLGLAVVGLLGWHRERTKA